MSLLATEGIGIFSDRHIALNDGLQPTEFKKSTHLATWELFSAWSRETGRAARLLGSISVESKSLAEWLEAIGVVKPVQQLVAEEWLRAWSIDLAIISDDRDLRNDMSYRPAGIRSPAPPPVDPPLELAAPLFNSWSTLEPSTDNGGIALDTSLLRQALMLVIKAKQCNYSSFDAAVSSLEDDMSKPLFQALNIENPSSAAIFREAKISNRTRGAATPILARSLLMLRLASASTASLFAAAEVSKADLEFWWSVAGTDLGMWDAPVDVETFSDLWIDVAEAKDEAEARISEMPNDGSVRSVAGILSRDVSLTQFSRTPMWLLGLS